MKTGVIISLIASHFVVYGIGYVVGFRQCFKYLKGKLEEWKNVHDAEK